MSSSIIRPEQFSTRVTDENRHRWTEGTLRHVIEACRGLRVSFEVMDGLAHDNAELIRLASSYSCRYGYLVRLHLSDGTTQDTVHRIDSLGVIVVPGHTSVSYRAAELHRKELSAATRIARARLDERGFGPGALRATAHGDHVSVALWKQIPGTLEHPYREEYVTYERVSLAAIAEFAAVNA